MRSPPLRRPRRAVILVVALVALLAVSLTGGQLLRSVTQSHRQGRQHAWMLQALWLADSGLERAIVRLQSDAKYTGETWLPSIGGGASGTTAPRGRIEIVITKDPSRATVRQVRIVASYPDDPIHRAVQTRQQTIFLTTGGDSP